MFTRVFLSYNVHCVFSWLLSVPRLRKILLKTFQNISKFLNDLKINVIASRQVKEIYGCGLEEAVVKVTMTIAK